MAWYYVFLIVAAVLVLPFAVGFFLSSRLKMPDHGWRISLVLFALAAGIAITATSWRNIKLGIDLSGGVILVYEVYPQVNLAAGDEDEDDPSGGDKSINMEELAAVISRRVNPGGVKEISIRPYGLNQIEIIIPDADEEEVKRIERTISAAGTLEFRIVANSTDHEALIEQAKNSNSRDVRTGGRVRARWIPVQPGFEERYVEQPEYFGIRQNPANPDQLEVLAVIDRHNVTGDYLRRVSKGTNERGQPAADFIFDTRGARFFGRLTGDNAPDPTSGHKRQLGIVLNGYMHNAPNIEGVIFDRGQISGDFEPEELADLITVLRAGSLPATLSEEPISSQLIDPTLGADTIVKGRSAMIISMAGVIVFIIIYYRFAGIVASLALLTNLVLILAVMISINAAFTLPGLAGLVLTVGMAVDANVLIFERIREELDRGAALRMAIRNGFGRATTTIIDANLTTLITATVLYVIGTDQVRGFAVTLWLGIVMSMFTAIFCSRVVFDIFERRRWITKLSMLRILGKTQIDFIGKRRLAAALSVLVIAVGLTGVFARGRNILNIDFTGGTSIELQFDQIQQVAEVRAKLAEALPDVTVSRKYARSGDEDPGLRFDINTSDQDIDQVKETLTKLFGDELARNEMEIDDLVPIAADDPPEESSDDESNPAKSGDLEAGSSESNDNGASGAAPPPDDQSSTAPAEPTLLALANFAQDDPPPSSSESEAAETPEATEAEEPATQPAGPEPSDASEDNTTAQENETSPDAANSTPPDEVDLEFELAKEPLVDAFAGGTSVILTFTVPMDEATVQDYLETALEAAGHGGARVRVETSEEAVTGVKRFARWFVDLDIPPDEAKPVLESIQTDLADTPFFASAVNVGGKVAGSARELAIYALLASLLFIVGYIWLRFQRVVFGLAAVVALVHDVLVTLGALALSYYVAPYLGFLLIDPFKIDLPTVAAFLTIIGYSLNDTIVVFDRVREVKGKSPDITAEMINTSVNQTLSRTVLTSLTTLIVVAILYTIGGQGIHGFAFALMVGVLVGTYSSIFVACPTLLFLTRRRDSTGKGKAASGRKKLAEASGVSN